MPSVWNKPQAVDPQDPFFCETTQRDLATACAESRLAVSPYLEKPLRIQSVQGHAQKGHKEFGRAGVRYPDATLQDVILAAGLNLEQVRLVRQHVIDQVNYWIDLAKTGNARQLSVDGQPLLGIDFLREINVDPEFVLKGMILAGHMDSYEWRMKTLEHYKQTIYGEELTLGGGETFLINPNKLLEWDLLGTRKLAEEEITDAEITEMRLSSIITDVMDPDAQVFYVRRKKGLGTSDDTAFIMMGKMYQQYGEIAARSAFLGGFIIDAVDTYDKCVTFPLEGGWDERIGKDIRADFPDLVSDNEILTLIYYAAKSNGGRIVSSSHKRLVEYVPSVQPSLPAIRHHLDFMEHGKKRPFYVGFERMRSADFYHHVQERINHFLRH